MVKNVCSSTTAGAVSCVCWSYAFGSTAIESIEGMGNSCCGARPKEAGWLSNSIAHGSAVPTTVSGQQRLSERPWLRVFPGL